MTKETHKTKSGKTAKKGLWYNIAQKKKKGKKMRKKGAKGAPTEAAIKRSQSQGEYMPEGKGTYGSKKGRPPEKKKKKKVKGKVNKLDMNKDGKITSADFAMLRGKKKKKK